MNGASPNTLDVLRQIRIDGKRPKSGCVWINFSDDAYYGRQRYSWLEQGEESAQVVIPTNACVDLLDLRCLVGLAVFADTDAWTDGFGRLVERIKAVRPTSLLVTIGEALEAMNPSNPDGFGGFAWTPAMGDMTFNEWCSVGCGGRKHG